MINEKSISNVVGAADYLIEQFYSFNEVMRENMPYVSNPRSMPLKRMAKNMIRHVDRKPRFDFGIRNLNLEIDDVRNDSLTWFDKKLNQAIHQVNPHLKYTLPNFSYVADRHSHLGMKLRLNPIESDELMDHFEANADLLDVVSKYADNFYVVTNSDFDVTLHNKNKSVVVEQFVEGTKAFNTMEVYSATLCYDCRRDTRFLTSVL